MTTRRTLRLLMVLSFIITFGGCTLGVSRESDALMLGSVIVGILLLIVSRVLYFILRD